MVHYTTDEGLPSNTVYSIYPDAKGYLWLATDKGVARYNGTDFKTYGIKDGLPDNEIFSFREDYNGRLWLATFNGKLCYFKDGIFYNEKNTPWLKVPEDCKHIEKIEIEADSSVTFKFMSRIYLLNIKRERKQLIPIGNICAAMLDTVPQPSQIPFVITKKLPGNRYQACGIARSFVFDESGRCLTSSYLTKNRRLTNTLYDTEKEYLVFGDSVFDTNEQYVCRISNMQSWRDYCFFKNGTGTFLGSKDGLYFNDSLRLLENIYVSAISRDFQGNLWISTLENGIYMIPADFLQMHYYTGAYKFGIEHATPIGDDFHFVDSKGNIFKESSVGRIETLYHPDSRYIFDNSPGNRLFAAGYVFLAANGKVILKSLFENKEKVFSASYNMYKNIMYDSTFYIFLTDAVIKFSDNNSLYYWQSNNVFNPGSRITSSAQDEHNKIWLARADSIFSLKYDTVTFLFRHPNTILRKMIVRSNFFVTYTDANQLLLFNRNRISASVDTISGGDITWDDMSPIDDTHILLSTNKTYFILTLYPDAHSSRAFSLDPVENIFLPKQAEYIYAGKDYCYFFKRSDILKVATSVLFQKAPPPRVVFTALTLPSKKYTSFSGLRFSYEESKNIKLSFEALSFSSKNLSYQYSLAADNETDHWQNTEGTELNLLMPSYGTYTIKVRARTISSGYSSPDVIKLVINRPYWATWWFWSIIVLSVAAITWWTVRLRTRRLLQKKQKEFEAEKRYQQAEYKALNALMNPHFIFNSMNNIQGLINEDAKQTANEYLVIFSDMIRQNMHNIERGTVSLFQEIALCRNYLLLEKLRFRDLINYRIEVEDEIDTEDIIIPPLIVQPLIENAIRHGLLPKESADSMVVLRIFERDNVLTIEVEDNGIGLTRAAASRTSLHQSLGLSNMRKRMEHLQKMQQKPIAFSIEELLYPDGNVKGTLAIITISLE